MKPVNVYILSRVMESEVFAAFEKQLSGREEHMAARKTEMATLRSMVENIEAYDESALSGGLFSSFYYSFSIPQISKEFDLLRISNELVINIELKSHATSEKVLRQLKKNKYYLKFLCRTVKLFSYVEEDKTFYQMTENGELEIVDVSEVCSLLRQQESCYVGDLEDLFRTSDFLVSPINSPDRFINGEYFLSQQQNEVVKDILEKCKIGNSMFFGITGAAGTGKTLLLYHLARRLGESGRCCVVHCGILPEGLIYLNNCLPSVDIVAVKDFMRNFNLSQYDIILVDECHRFRKEQYTQLVKKTVENQIPVIFSYDQRQVLSKTEQKAQIVVEVERQMGHGSYKHEPYVLTKKVRTNKAITSFIDRVMDLHSHHTVPNYSSITVEYANNAEEAHKLIAECLQRGYVYINYTGSAYHFANFDQFDKYCDGNNTHTVIGQEFDRVVMLMDATFYYDEKGVLQANGHPNPNYLYTQLLYQGLSRTREELTVIVVNNTSLLKSISDILGK